MPASGNSLGCQLLTVWIANLVKGRHRGRHSVQVSQREAAAPTECAAVVDMLAWHGARRSASESRNCAVAAAVAGIVMVSEGLPDW